MIRQVPHPVEILFGGGAALACAPNGELRADDLHGLFAGDTRVLSTYRITIGGVPWHLLSRLRVSASAMEWDYQNGSMAAGGLAIDEGVLHLRVGRVVMGALHDDLTVTSFLPRTTAVRLSLQLDADFSDIFQVKERSTPPRLNVGRRPDENGVSLIYERDGFRRAAHIRLHASSGRPEYVGAQAVFDLVLRPHQPWRCCVEVSPEVDGTRYPFRGDPHRRQGEPAAVPPAPALEAGDILLQPFERGCQDLRDLMLTEGGAAYVGAGAPWFLTLFGRDTLTVTLMTGLLGPQHVDGTLQLLGRLQARATDDLRDAQQGKILHEVRHGELAHDHAIPHTPYFGTHDAPALFVLALWNLFRWTGDRTALQRHLGAARAALRWCEELGDQDGDGLLEYRTRSPQGYRNQGWKDAGDAIVDENGCQAGLPIATVELQGYWYAAMLAMAELCDAVGEGEEAARQRRAASSLRALVEDRFWMEGEGTYAQALDGAKRPMRSISCNPGHLLWCGLPAPERARRLTRRLLEPDMFSGYGVRTLSSANPAWNPLSYQLGSVWPHDNALIAAGMMRHGEAQAALRVLRGILDAAGELEQARLPELFCGFARNDAPPVPYERANIPQAWAAAAPVLAAQIILGLVPDVPRGRCAVAPCLPEWLPSLRLTGIEIGGGPLDLRVERRGGESRLVEWSHATLKPEEGRPPAPLWGAPF